MKDARVNAEDSTNVEFRLGKTEDVLPTLEETVDALILDPPRAGCDRRALDAVLRLGPRRVAYVSCEPDALARDLAVLVEGGYRVEMVQPVDLFPYTHHIECVAVLARDVDGAGIRADAGVGVTEAARAAAVAGGRLRRDRLGR